MSSSDKKDDPSLFELLVEGLGQVLDGVRRNKQRRAAPKGMKLVPAIDREELALVRDLQAREWINRVSAIAKDKGVEIECARLERDNPSHSDRVQVFRALPRPGPSGPVRISELMGTFTVENWDPFAAVDCIIGKTMNHNFKPKTKEPDFGSPVDQIREDLRALRSAVDAIVARVGNVEREMRELSMEIASFQENRTTREKDDDGVHGTKGGADQH